MPIISEIDVDTKLLIKMELLFQLIFLYFLSLFFKAGQRHVPVCTGNGSDWAPASTLDLSSPLKDIFTNMIQFRRKVCF